MQELEDLIQRLAKEYVKKTELNEEQIKTIADFSVWLDDFIGSEKHEK